jgi:cardiolipin synthase
MTTLARTESVALLLLHVLLAGYVTGHILLTKRDVGASIAWIGVAWLSPIVGSALYALLGVNRVKTRATLLKEEVGDRGDSRSVVPAAVVEGHLAPLERAVGRVTGRQAAEANEIVALRNGDEAYPQMVAAIDAAARSVALSSYIFRLDDSGRAFVEALVRAHRRGVAVRVIIDGVGGGYLTSPVYKALRRDGVAAARFLHSPLPWRMPFLNLRTHKKLLSIDGALVFTGGLNIGDENCLRKNPAHPVRDRHFRIRGPVVTQLAEVFAEDWFFLTGESLAGDAWFPSVSGDGRSTARAIISGPDQDIEKIEAVVMQAIACARKAIMIRTPYFLCEDRVTSALILAAMRGVTVDIIVPEKNNHLLFAWAMQAHIGVLVEAGCRVWSNPPPFDHTKIMTVDGAWALIGSSNWDMRSFRLNFELDVEIYDHAFVAELEAAADLKKGSPITSEALHARPLVIKLRDSAARLLLPYL